MIFLLFLMIAFLIAIVAITLVTTCWWLILPLLLDILFIRAIVKKIKK